MERTRKSLQKQLDKLEKANQDDTLTFEQLGIDRLFVDEAHEFKNLFVATKLQNVAGISNSASQKALDLFLKCRYLDEKTGGNGVIFATGTPAGKFMLTVFAALSQLEREQLKQRQREGIEIAKAQGKYTGRKPIEIDWTRFGQLYGEWKSKNITGRDFMRRMDLSANTFYRRIREYEAEHGIAEPTSA